METTTKLELLDPAALIPSAANPRVHSQRQIRELRASLREYGVVSPVLVDQERNIIAGHEVVEAALAEKIKKTVKLMLDGISKILGKGFFNYARYRNTCTG